MVLIKDDTLEKMILSAWTTTLKFTLDKLARKGITIHSSEFEIYRFWTINEGDMAEGLASLLLQKKVKELETLRNSMQMTDAKDVTVNTDAVSDHVLQSCSDVRDADVSNEVPADIVVLQDNPNTRRSVSPGPDEYAMAAVQRMDTKSQDLSKKRQGHKRGPKASRFCNSCHKVGHDEQQCWTLGLGKPPPYYLKRRERNKPPHKQQNGLQDELLTMIKSAVKNETSRIIRLFSRVLTPFNT